MYIIASLYLKQYIHMSACKNFIIWNQAKIAVFSFFFYVYLNWIDFQIWISNIIIFYYLFILHAILNNECMYALLIYTYVYKRTMIDSTEHDV